MNVRAWVGLFGLAGVALATPLHGQGQQPVTTEMPRADVPWGPGEDLTYEVRLGWINVGDASLRVEALDTVRGFETYRFALDMDASAFFGAMQLHDRYLSWLDTRMLVSRRYVSDVHQLNYKSRREYEIYPEEGRWERMDNDDEGETPGLMALDEIAFVQFARTLNLGVGEEISFNRYFKEEDNPVIVRVLRKERVEVPAGTFDAIVVQPVISDGLFSEEATAELYFTDDEHRHLVYLRSSIPVVGALSMHLTELSAGVRVSETDAEEVSVPSADSPVNR